MRFSFCFGHHPSYTALDLEGTKLLILLITLRTSKTIGHGQCNSECLKVSLYIKLDHFGAKVKVQGLGDL